MDTVFETEAAHSTGIYTKHPVSIVRGEGATCGTAPAASTSTAWPATGWPTWVTPIRPWRRPSPNRRAA